jgi:hypothetical protein
MDTTSSLWLPSLCTNSNTASANRVSISLFILQKYKPPDVLPRGDQEISQPGGPSRENLGITLPADKEALANENLSTNHMDCGLHTD